jgi:hypothetical protein
MSFEARSLRVQLPCKAITVVAAEDYDAQVQAHRYWWAIALENRAKLGLLGRNCEECSGNPSEPLCDNASEDFNIWAVIDARVLPVLRQQLEARLQQIKEVEETIGRTR